MTLALFIQELLEEGKVTVAGQVIDFQPTDTDEAIALLQRYYEDDSLEMPHITPAFHAPAAIWATKYLYLAIQLAALRDLDDEAVKAYLTDFPGEKTPEAIYSVDLLFRYLPDMLHLAKGLAPGDVLVACLKNILHQWPFSSVGQEVGEDINHNLILQHPSLKAAYVDRIIACKDKGRLSYEPLRELVQEAMGEYSTVLWPDFKMFTITNNQS